MRILLAVLLLASCGGPIRSLPLDPKFLPLARVASTDAVPSGLVSTVYQDALTRDVSLLLESYPEGSVGWDALFFHEQQHSIRESLNPAYLDTYAVSPDFRWAEEQIGYAVEIRYRLAHRADVDPAWYATVLSTRYGGMVSYDVALAWVLSLVGP